MITVEIIEKFKKRMDHAQIEVDRWGEIDSTISADWRKEVDLFKSAIEIIDIAKRTSDAFESTLETLFDGK